MQTLMKKKEKSKWVLRADAGEASVNQKQDTMDAEYKRRFDRHIDEPPLQFSIVEILNTDHVSFDFVIVERISVIISRFNHRK